MWCCFFIGRYFFEEVRIVFLFLFSTKVFFLFNYTQFQFFRWASGFSSEIFKQKPWSGFFFIWNIEPSGFFSSREREKLYKSNLAGRYYYKYMIKSMAVHWEKVLVFVLCMEISLVKFECDFKRKVFKVKISEAQFSYRIFEKFHILPKNSRKFNLSCLHNRFGKIWVTCIEKYIGITKFFVIFS